MLQVLLFTSIVVILTLVINGSLTKTLLQKLGILKPQAVKVEFLIHSIKEMEDYADTHCSHLKTDVLVGDPDWDRVKELSNIDTTLLVDPDDIPPEAAKHSTPAAESPGEKTPGVKWEENAAAEALQVMPVAAGVLTMALCNDGCCGGNGDGDMVMVLVMVI